MKGSERHAKKRSRNESLQALKAFVDKNGLFKKIYIKERKGETIKSEIKLIFFTQ